MLQNLLKRLRQGSSEAEALDPGEARIAVAALLVSAARADGAFERAEQDMIERILIGRYRLSRADAVALRDSGETAEAAASDIQRFTKLVKQSLPLEERVDVLEALWRVVLSDAVRDPHEDALVRTMTELLGLSPRDSVHARQRVADQN